MSEPAPREEARPVDIRVGSSTHALGLAEAMELARALGRLPPVIVYGIEGKTFEIEMPNGVPYKYHPDFPTNYVYILSIASSTGFVPMFENGSSDSRHLGVRVRLIPTYAGTQ